MNGAILNTSAITFSTTGCTTTANECAILGPSHSIETSFMRVPVKAEIFGQTYTISGELDEDYVLKLARFVDEKMRAVASGTATVDTQKVAVLAALAIADELHSAQRDLGYREDVLREQAERCLVLVERALKQSA
jgi:cell division protein ZapA